MSESTQSPLSRAQHLLSEFELVEAEAAFQKAIELMPHEPQVYLGMARLKLLHGAPDIARGFAEKAAELTEDKAEANALIASCALQKDDVEEALALLKRTNQWHPNNPLVLSNLGKAYARNAEYEKAKTHSLKALELGALAEEVEHDLGIICSGLHQFEEAVDHFVASIAANPRYLPPYFRLSEFAKLLGLVDETIEIYENGVGLMPHMPQLREELYVMYMIKSDPEQAMLQAMELAAQRGWAEDYLRVGNTALLLEDLDAAKLAYETAIKVDPDDMGGYINLGHLHRLLKDREKALEYYHHVAGVYPELYKPYLGTALVYTEIDEDFEKGRLCLMKALEFAPQSYDILIHLADCCLKVGQQEEAETYANVALGLSDSPRAAERAQEIISQAKPQ